MAKAIQYFAGSDSFGRSVDMAERADGQWFARWQEDKGCYGVGFCRWTAYKTPIHPTRLLNQCDNNPEEYTQLTDEQSKSMVEWGFNTLKSFSPKGLRLPN